MVYVNIPKCTIKVPGMKQGIVPIFPVAVSISQNISVRGVIVKGFKRQQLPLVPAYAYTDYKSQGRTLRRAIVDLATARGQGVYVMLSRVKTLEGLIVLRWFPNSKIVQRMSAELRDEIKRLNEIDQRTKTMFEEGKLAPWRDGKDPTDQNAEEETEDEDSEDEGDTDAESDDESSEGEDEDSTDEDMSEG